MAELPDNAKLYKVFAITKEQLVIPLGRAIASDEQYRLVPIHVDGIDGLIERVAMFYTYNLTPFKRRAEVVKMKASHKFASESLLAFFEAFVLVHVPRQKRKYLDIIGVMLDIITHPERGGAMQLNDGGDVAYYIEYT